MARTTTSAPAQDATPAPPPGPRPDHDPSAPVTDRDAAAAYVASVCFKHGPPRLIGAELEWLVRDTAHPDRPLDPTTLARALGPYAPPTLCPTPHPGAVLPGGGSVTVEPGGQVEIASRPAPGPAALLSDLGADVVEIRRRLAAEDLALVRRASDPLRPPRRILDVPRYAAMEAAFDRIGPHGRTMMCSTSAVQVCLDAGEGPAVGERWSALHELGPVLVAAFANSPAVHGRRTGWKSSRMASWLSLDPERTSPPTMVGPDPGATYAERALDTSLLCVRRGDSWSPPPQLSFREWITDAAAGRTIGRPTWADLDYHLTTLFPPVRPQGHLEVRYLDQQAGDDWAVPVVVLDALFDDPATLDRARAAAAPAVGRWAAAARHGLADRVLRRAAGEVFELAHRKLADLDVGPDVRARVEEVISERVLRGVCPADEPLGEPGEHLLGPPVVDPFATPRAGTDDDGTAGEPGDP